MKLILEGAELPQGPDINFKECVSLVPLSLMEGGGKVPFPDRPAATCPAGS